MNLATPQTILSDILMLDPRALPGMVDQVRMGIQNQRMGASEGQLQPPTVQVEMYDEIGSQLQANENGETSTEGHPPKSVIAVVSLTGVITRHGYSGWWDSVPGTLQIGRYLTKLDADESVGTIILFVNSPGGTVAGTPELAELIYKIRKAGRTRVISVVDTLMASAATYIGTAAGEVFAVPSADVGSVGVINGYADYSEMLSKQGIKIEYCRIPEKKARYTGYEPLDDDMRETMQARIEEAYGWFVRDMSRNRDVSEKHVRQRFGQGEVMSAEDGIDAKLIDGIASIDEVIADLASEARKRRSSRNRSAAMASLEAAQKQTAELDSMLSGDSKTDDGAAESPAESEAETAEASR